LADNTWLYGGSIDTVRQTIANGRQGQMPAHLERLGEVRTRLVAAYVLSAAAPSATAQSTTLSNAGAVAAQAAAPANAAAQNTTVSNAGAAAAQAAAPASAAAPTATNSHAHTVAAHSP
jgi:hypothetical protein